MNKNLVFLRCLPETLDCLWKISGTVPPPLHFSWVRCKGLLKVTEFIQNVLSQTLVENRDISKNQNIIKSCGMRRRNGSGNNGRND